jgi:hypothetical protein
MSTSIEALMGIMATGKPLDRYCLDLQLTALCSQQCGYVAASVTEVLKTEDLSNRYALGQACGRVYAAIVGLETTGLLRKTRIAQAKRRAAAEPRAYMSLPDTVREAKQLRSLRRTQALAHKVGHHIVELMRDDVEEATGEFLDSLDDLKLFGLVFDGDVSAAAEAYRLEAILPILTEGGVQ